MFEKPIILVVEDDSAIRTGTVRILEKAGHSVLEAASGEECLRICRQDNPGIVLLDVVLPGIDGLEVCRRIKADPKMEGVLVVMISGMRSASEQQADGLMSGADDYIARPIANKEFLARMEAAFRIKAATDALRRSEAREKRLNVVLRAIRCVDQLIVRETDPVELMRKACKELRETLGYHDAWAVLCDNDGNITTGVCADAGIDLSDMNDDLARGIWPPCAEQASANDDVQVIADPRKVCNGCPLASLTSGHAAFGRWLRYDDDTHGFFTALVSADAARDEEEKNLFRELTDDLAAALHRLGMEERRREAERQRDQYALIASAGQEAMSLIDRRYVYLAVNKAYERFAGKSSSEILGKTVSDVFGEALFLKDIKKRLDRCFAGEASQRHAVYEIPDLGKQLLRISYSPCRQDGVSTPCVIVVVSNITDLWIARNAVRKSEERYQSLFNNAPVGIFETTSKGETLYVNPHMARLAGADSPEEAVERFNDLGRQLYSVPWRREEFLRDVGEKGDVRGFEYEAVRLDGARRWFSMNARVSERLEDGGFLIEGFTWDITDNKQTKRLLEERERLFRTAFETASVGKSLTLPDGRLNRVNTALCGMLGYDADSLANKTYADVTHPDDLDASRELVRRLIAGETDSGRMEKRYVRSDGSVLWADVSTKLIRDELGNPEMFITHIYDISDRKNAEERLRRQKEQLQTILDNLPLMVAFLDREGSPLWVNRAWEETLGWSLEDARKIDMLSKLYPEPEMLEEVKAFMRNAESEWAPFRTQTRSGEVIDTNWINIPLPDGANIGIGENVTERNKSEKQRKELEVQLFHAQKMEAVGRLAGGVAHDFNNLLSVILGYGEMVLGHMGEDHPDHESMQELHQAAQKAKNLTRQLLAFSRKQLLEIRLLDLNKVAAGFEKLMGRLIGEEINLTLRTTADPILLKADQSQLEQVLMNLAVNARDAMPKGGELSIVTGVANLRDMSADGHPSAVPGRYAVIRVRDTGTGMDSVTLNRIFEPFFTTKGMEEGSGLGLATVYGIVNQHNGTLSVHSEQGRGSEFRIYLPCEEGGSKTEAPTPAVRQKPSGGAETILVVEDDLVVRRLACRILESHGYRVFEADSPKAAIDLAQKHADPIHLLLSDVVMPDIRGPEVYRRISEIHPETKVLYMTGYSEKVILREDASAEKMPLIRKPLSVALLLDTVSEILLNR